MSDTHASPPQIPILETERLRLRAHRLEDFVHSAAMWADARITEHIGGKPQSEEESWTRFLRYAGHWSVMGFGYWVVEEKASGNFLGEVGFADYKRDIQPSLKGVPEIGWVLAARAHGQGFATEAVRAAVAWGDEYFPSKRTACIIAPENVASVRVADKCGYREFQRTTYKGKPALMLERKQ
jgi:RimJ/RimL family protein N-acetyltransferase